MTACTNHGGKARRVVTAALVGVLSVGTVPMVALATEAADGIEVMFADPEGAFSNAEVTSATFQHGDDLLTKGSDGVWETTYVENKPVILDTVAVRMFGTGAGASFSITANDPEDNYEVAYYNRGTDGKNIGDELTGDICEVGKYVAVVTAVDGNYKGGVIYVPFDINPIQISSVTVDGPTSVTYNALSHDFDFVFDGVKVYEGVDYEVYYVPVGHDATEASATEVKNAGEYKAVVTGIGHYAGTVELSQTIKVSPLDLTGATSATYVHGLTSTSATEPENPYCIWIDGVRYDDGSAIMGELKADIDLTVMPSDTVWHDNGDYIYKVVSAKGATDPNIKGSAIFAAHKVSYNVDFSYDGAPLQASHEVFMNDADTQFDFSEVTGHAANGTVDGVNVTNGDIAFSVYDAWGNDVLALGWDWQNMPGEYNVVVGYVAPDNTIGGFQFVDVTVYREAVNADAKAAVLYDTNGDGEEEVVSSVSKVYDGTDLIDDIRVAVEDASGRNVVADCDVAYYNADGKEVGELVDAGTYTLKVTSELYKLSGTTEMTITIGKKDLSGVKVGALTTASWDGSSKSFEYLPWLSDGYALSNVGYFTSLDVQYKNGNSWVAFPMKDVLVTILDASGNEVETVTDEGAYTLHFTARNDEAENNYVIPADVTFHCVQNYNDFANDVYNHVTFADVSYTDYYCDSVAWVKAKGFMNGYNGTRLFGPEDDITRGMVASILYNMAGGDNLGLDEDKFYNELVGWKSFDDVDGKAYYGRAIAWAKEAGVVNGYDDGTFRPDQAVSRQEFAGMLANYAERFDTSFKAAGADALDEMPDAGEVADWAKEAVAWAVENGIMGNGGFIAPGSTIIRADAAGMVFNYAK